MTNTRLNRYVLLAVSFSLCTAFSWGESSDPCLSAKSLVKQYETEVNQIEKAAIEQKIIRECPDGAAGHFILAKNYERGENPDRAIAAYKEAIRLDPTLYQASGSLGLLLLKKGDFDSSAVELSKALQGGGDPQYHKGLASVFTAKKLYSLSLYYCEEALKSYPEDQSLVRQRALSLAGTGDMVRAAAEYKKLMASNPANIEIPVELSEIYASSSHPDKAIEILKATSSANPSNKDVHKRLFYLYEKKGDTASADYEAVLAGLPNRKKIESSIDLLKEADSLAKSEKYEEAVAIYRKVLKESPSNSSVRNKLVKILISQGKDDEALAEIMDIVRHKGENSELYYLRAKLFLKKGLNDEAIVAFKQALAYPDASSSIRLELAELYDKRGGYPQAVEQYREYISKKPDDIAVMVSLAKVLIKSKNAPEATAIYISVLKTAPENLEAHRALAAIYLKDKKIEDAEKHYKEVIRLKKDDQDARKVLTSIYVKKKKYDELVALLSESVEIDPKDSTNHYKLGLVYEFARNYEKSLESYSKAVELKEDNAKALNAMGRVSMKLGKLSEAKGYLERARQIDPEIEEATVLLSNIRDEFSENSKSKKYLKKKKKKGKTSAKKKLKKSTKKKPVKKAVKKTK